MARTVFDCLGLMTTGVTPYTTLDARSGVGLTNPVGQMAFFGSSDNSGPLGMVFQHFCSNGVCRSDITSTRYGISGNDLSLNVDSTDPNTGGGLYIQYRGGVGIGTSNPTTHNGRGFVVRGTASDTRGIIELWDGGASGGKSVIQQVGGDTYIGQLGKGTGEGRVYFLTGGSGTSATISMTILCAGNVGIGTTSPDSKVHVCNAVAGGTNNYSVIIQNACTVSDARAGIAFSNNSQTPSAGGLSGASIQTSNNGIDGAGSLLFGTLLNGANTERMRISHNGNVGIGTSNPANAIHVCRAAGNSAVLALQVGGNYGYFFMNGCCMAIGSDSGTSGIKFHISRQAPDDSLLVTNTGKVSVGSTAPNGQLTVAVDQSVNNQHFNIIGTQASYCQEYSFGIPTSTKDLRIYDGTAGAVRFTLTCLGNIGVGTTSPIDKLEVAGGIHTSGTASASKACTGYLDYYVGQVRLGITGPNTTTPSIFRIDQYSSNASIYCTPFYITETSNIGVNTTTPSYRLHVNGTFYAAGSSQDYKEGICNYNTDSCLFMCLKPVTYQYKDEFKHLGKELKSETQIGLIAEHVAEVMPELAILVNEEDNKVVRNVDYEKLSIILLSEVQKLRQEVDDLKNK